MITGISFQTRARTVDHLGREQIADTPTAISELWKNSYDAYARGVELNIYDDVYAVASLVDDGHGMNDGEFVNRWLVVGTESKAGVDGVAIKDRNGLRARLRQGQKGIGRLSCANLGPILLFVSRRSDGDFVAALVDWRLFENPFLNLSDVEIPVTGFKERNQLFERLPGLCSTLLTNLGNGSDNERAQRLRTAWKEFDDLHADEVRAESATRSAPPSDIVRNGIKSIDFREKHFERWPVWSGASAHGTALVVGEINYDLQSQLVDTPGDSSAKHTRERFFETLSSFVDPFVDSTRPELNALDPQFTYAVRTWRASVPTLVLGTEKQFDRRMVDQLEHKVEGSVNSQGVFTGHIRAFGKDISDICTIEPPNDLLFSTRADGTVGTFDIYIASMEFQLRSTTHTEAEFNFYSDLASRYAGFMVFRDGLRVMPYGRPDNDFFEIEMRRSKHAGREFWNHRQMFGRLAISRRRNPNLKDKAGREGIVDNRAAKTLKALVSNILQQAARRYFGTDSEFRSELLPEIQKNNARERAAEARNRLRKRQRQEFRRRLLSQSKELPQFVQSVKQFSSALAIQDEADLLKAQARLEEIREKQQEFKLPGAPNTLGTLEGQFNDYRRSMAALQETVNHISSSIDDELIHIVPSNPKAALEKQLARNASQIHRHIQVWKRRIEILQRAEFDRIHGLIKERNKLFHAEATPIVHRVEGGSLQYAEASRLMEQVMRRMDEDNVALFVPYIEALESLTESIDLQHLAAFGTDEVSDLRSEIDRLNSLAQLGIAVEIVGHELQNYDEFIGSGLRRLPEEVRRSSAAADIEFGYEGLTDQLRFLSPLRLAGQRVQKWISGAEIFGYISDFFKIPLASNKIHLEATSEFQKFRIFEEQSRILPVFINLVNNSIYWLSTKQSGDRQIRLSVVSREVVISDNGPGVQSEDVDSLFSLFFTRKTRGGRGVGLYLSRANLTAGGHRIRYEPEISNMPLQGANFLIEFRGVEFDNAG